MGMIFRLSCQRFNLLSRKRATSELARLTVRRTPTLPAAIRVCRNRLWATECCEICGKRSWAGTIQGAVPSLVSKSSSTRVLPYKLGSETFYCQDFLPIARQSAFPVTPTLKLTRRAPSVLS